MGIHDPEEVQIDDIRMSWESSFTDPAFFDQTNFCFLVHCPARPNFNVLSIQGPQITESLEDAGKLRHERYNLLQYPERVSIKPVISCSIIARRPDGLSVLSTFTDFGIILDAPFECLLEMYPAQAETDFTRTHADTQADPEVESLISVETLLTRSRTSELNELVVRGIRTVEDETSDRQERTFHTRVIGFFAKYGGDYPLDPENAALMEEHAKRLGLPFIKIQERLPAETLIHIAYHNATAAVAGIIFNVGEKYFILRSQAAPNGIVLGVREKNGDAPERPITQEELELCKETIRRDLTESQRADGQKFLENLDELFETRLIENSCESNVGTIDPEQITKVLKLARSQDFLPKSLVMLLAQSSSFLAMLYEADSRVWESRISLITIGMHTTTVLDQFENQIRPDPWNSKILGLVDFRIMLGLHDIGKSLGTGNEQQHTYTEPIMRDVLSQLGFETQKIDLIAGIVCQHIIGNYFRGGIDSSQAALEIKTLAARLEVSVEDLIPLLIQYYMADASSYTEFAGGRKSLDYIFTLENGRLGFSADYADKIQQLQSMLF